MKKILIECEVPDDFNPTIVEMVALGIPKKNYYEDGDYYEAKGRILDQPCIQAKALRKKGTDKWYCWNTNGNEWRWFSTPDTLPSSTKFEDLAEPPEDAELVNIKIIIEE